MISIDTLKQKMDELIKQRDQLAANLNCVQGAIQLAQLLLDEAVKADASSASEAAKVEA